MDVNIAIILVRAGLLDDCAETADESSLNHCGSGHGLICPRKTKEPVKDRPFHNRRLSTFFSIPYAGKCLWANPNMRYFQPDFKYRQHKLGNSGACIERLTTTPNKTVCSKLDEAWEAERGMPALLAMDPSIKFLWIDLPRLKWTLKGPVQASVYNQVKICQWMSVVVPGSSFFSSFKCWEKVLRGTPAQPNNTQSTEAAMNGSEIKC